jgi:hypothetical protein
MIDYPRGGIRETTLYSLAGHHIWTKKEEHTGAIVLEQEH